MELQIEVMIKIILEINTEKNASHVLYQTIKLGEIRALFVYSYGTILSSCNSEKEPVKTVLHRRYGAATIYQNGWLNFPATIATFPPFASAKHYKVVSRTSLSCLENRDIE